MKIVDECDIESSKQFAMRTFKTYWFQSKYVKTLVAPQTVWDTFDSI